MPNATVTQYVSSMLISWAVDTAVDASKSMSANICARQQARDRYEMFLWLPISVRRVASRRFTPAWASARHERPALPDYMAYYHLLVGARRLLNRKSPILPRDDAMNVVAPLYFVAF